MRLCVVLVLCFAGYVSSESKETFRARMNPNGVTTAENMMKSMIRSVNDLIKQNSNLPNMQIGPVAVEGFSVRTLDTANVKFLMGSPVNTLGLALNNGRVHLTAQLAVYIPVIFVGNLRVAGQFDTYGDGIQASLKSGLTVKYNHLHANDMSCSLRVNGRVDLHNGLINHFANQILQGLLPGVTQGVCRGVEKFGVGMANSIFKMIPTNVNVFNMFRLDFPLVNFRIWNRHIVGGLGMEVRPANNVAVSKGGLTVRALPEVEDGHMACTAISEFVVNTASRTFIPVGFSIQMNVASVMALFIKDVFNFAVFVKGTVTQSPMLTIENGQIKISVGAKGQMTNAAGTTIPGTATKPTVLSVSCPTNETPMFSNVVVQVSGMFNLKFKVNIANIIDMMLGLINKSAGRIQKRATNADLSRAANKMFFSKWFSGFNMKLSARHGAIIACLSGSPNSAATNKVLGLLRSSFYRG